MNQSHDQVSTREVKPKLQGRMRMKGFVLGLILMVSSVLVATSMTALVSLVLLAIPILTLFAVASLIGMLVPSMFGSKREQPLESPKTTAHEDAVLLSLEGFWQHAHSWKDGHAHFRSFEPIDREIVIHLDSKSDDSSIRMQDFMQMTAGNAAKKVDIDQSLEGLSDYKRM